MSGSGKTTVTTTLQERIVELFGEKYKPVVLSSDDYHFGKKFLNEKYGAPYKDWDAARTYNTSLLATDIGWLQKGLHILKNRFDFDSQEPVFDKEVTPSPFIIIEGLYAASKDLENVLDIHEKLPTTIGTSVERDLRRLVIDTRANDEFPDPESRLKYLIESAIPEYMSQVFPERKRFSESSRPMAKRAFMLARLNEMS
jgi:uridine kinase